MAENLNNDEVAEEMNKLLQQLRTVSAEIKRVEERIPAGLQLHRGLKRVHLEVQSAGHDLERLCAVTRTMIV